MRSVKAIPALLAVAVHHYALRQSHACAACCASYTYVCDIRSPEQSNPAAAALHDASRLFLSISYCFMSFLSFCAYLVVFYAFPVIACSVFLYEYFYFKISVV
jgi:hypothetical protein